MNSTTQTPAVAPGDPPLAYLLLPLLLIIFIGATAAAVVYLRRKRRIDRLRHQLLPVYSYDPSEEPSEEQDVLWKQEDTKVLHGWMRNYQQHWPLMKDPNA